MLFLIFSIGQKNYTISSQEIIEVIPNLISEGKKITNEPLCFAGLINYHGAQIPVLDLCILLNNKSCPKLLSSRIILLQSLKNRNFHKSIIGPIGLLAEKITETIKINIPKNIDRDSPQFRAFIESKVSRPDKIIKLFDFDTLLPDNLHEAPNLR